MEVHGSSVAGSHKINSRKNTFQKKRDGIVDSSTQRIQAFCECWSGHVWSTRVEDIRTSFGLFKLSYLLSERLFQLSTWRSSDETLMQPAITCVNGVTVAEVWLICCADNYRGWFTPVYAEWQWWWWLINSTWYVVTVLATTPVFHVDRFPGSRWLRDKSPLSRSKGEISEGLQQY